MNNRWALYARQSGLSSHLFIRGMALDWRAFSAKTFQFSKLWSVNFEVAVSQWFKRSTPPTREVRATTWNPGPQGSGRIGPPRRPGRSANGGAKAGASGAGLGADLPEQLEAEGMAGIALQQPFERPQPFSLPAGRQVNARQRDVGALELRRPREE